MTRDQINKIENPKVRAQIEAQLTDKPVKSFSETPGALRVEARDPVVSSEPIIAVEEPKSTQMFKSFSVRGPIVGKPRMTQADRWKKRPRVLRYREYCDRIRAAAQKQVGDLPPNPLCISIVAHIAMPKSWSKKKRLAMDKTPHRAKPDWDNIGKSVCDALLDEDSCLSGGAVDKVWCWCPENELTEITLHY